MGGAEDHVLPHRTALTTLPWFPAWWGKSISPCEAPSCLETSLLGTTGRKVLPGCLVKGKKYNPLHRLRSVFLLVGG